ncbi:EamA family transporter [Advenella sp. S44]|uniref:EamA family transporter n=1 Tax=Advenella sp. S44 TaxID=1982755 RepID=UPI000C2A4B29|nr:DMT family transporter [Advenella sp. S44]PJX26543.1 EamA family transporter [Advenella sp. S44]
MAAGNSFRTYSQTMGIAALVGSMASLCIGTSFAKSLFDAVGAQGTTAYRLGFSALLLWCVWRPWRFPLSRRNALAIASYGLCLGLINFLFYMAIRTVPLGLCIAIEFLGPLSLAIFSSRRRIDFLWIGFVALGLYLLIPQSQQDVSAIDPVGVLYAVGAGIFWALYIVFGQRTRNIHPGQATSLGITVAALLVLPFGIAHSGALLLDPSFMIAGLLVAILSSAVPYSLEMISLRSLPRKTMSILLSLEPAMGALAGLVILHEQLTLAQWLAIAFIVSASIGCATTSPAPPVTDIERDKQ